MNIQILTLKGRAYDLFAIIQAAQSELGMVNEQIAQLSQQEEKQISENPPQGSGKPEPEELKEVKE